MVTETNNASSPLRSERLEARISKEQKELFKKAASFQGRSLTDFVIGSVQEAATRTVREHETLCLTTQDREIFVLALLGDDIPGKNLGSAAQRYKERLGL